MDLFYFILPHFILANLPLHHLPSTPVSKKRKSKRRYSDGYVGFNMSPELRQRCVDAAKELEIPVSMLLRTAVKEYFSNREVKGTDRP